MSEREVWIVEHRSRGRADLIWYPNYCFIHLTEEATLNICKERTLQYPNTEYRAVKYIPATSATAPANQLRLAQPDSELRERQVAALLQRKFNYMDGEEYGCPFCGWFEAHTKDCTLMAFAKSTDAAQATHDVRQWFLEKIGLIGDHSWDDIVAFVNTLGKIDATANPELHAPSSELVATNTKFMHPAVLIEEAKEYVRNNPWGIDDIAAIAVKVMAICDDHDRLAKSAARCPNCDEVK